MPDWVAPEIVVDDDGMHVDMSVGDVSVDMSAVDQPDQVEDVIDAGSDDSVVLDVSGNDVVSVTVPYEAFKEMFLSDSEDVSSNDLSADFLASEELIEPYSVASGTFTPQQWQVNLASGRPIGYHYVMTRLSSSNDYILVLGRDVTYDGNIYRYVDCDYYRVYTYISGSSTRYDYSVTRDASGSIGSTTYVVYSDLFFDYIGSRSFEYTFLIMLIFIFVFLLLIWWRGGNRT